MNKALCKPEIYLSMNIQTKKISGFKKYILLVSICPCFQYQGVPRKLRLLVIRILRRGAFNRIVHLSRQDNPKWNRNIWSIRLRRTDLELRTVVAILHRRSNYLLTRRTVIEHHTRRVSIKGPLLIVSAKIGCCVGTSVCQIEGQNAVDGECSVDA